ncbi:MAG: hypothetical protein ACJ77V_03915 [Chloroflexota bacterium]
MSTVISLVILLLPVFVLAAVGVAALFWGVDSRDDSFDPRRPARPGGIG